MTIIYTSEFLREIWKTTQSNHDLGHITHIIRTKIISLGIRKQPISHPYCRSRAGNSLLMPNQSATKSCRPRNIYLEVKLASVQSQKPGLNPVMNTPVKTLHHQATYAVLYPIQMTGSEEALHYYTTQVLKSNNWQPWPQPILSVHVMKSQERITP